MSKLLDRTPLPASVPAVSVIIPTYNRAADLARAVDNLARQSIADIEVVVVDNGSTDETAREMGRREPEWGGRLHYVRQSPQGPAAARNRGLALARGAFVLFHDSDVQLGAGWIEQALARLTSAPTIGAVGGRIVYAFDPERVNAYGGDMGWFGLAWDVHEGAPLIQAADAAERIWINCSAMLARKDAILAAGEFDPDFFYGYEDTDIGWRLNLRGYRVEVMPQLTALHHVDPVPGPGHPDIVFHYCKNRLRMLIRNAQGPRLPGVLAAYLAYSLIDWLTRGPRASKWKALTWNLRHWRATWQLRRATQRDRLRSDAQILQLGQRRWFPPTRLGGLRRRIHGTPIAADARTNGHDDRV